jgi:hypothetical protein
MSLYTASGFCLVQFHSRRGESVRWTERLVRTSEQTKMGCVHAKIKYANHFDFVCLSLSLSSNMKTQFTRCKNCDMLNTDRYQVEAKNEWRDNGETSNNVKHVRVAKQYRVELNFMYYTERSIGFEVKILDGPRVVVRRTDKRQHTSSASSPPSLTKTLDKHWLDRFFVAPFLSCRRTDGCVFCGEWRIKFHITFICIFSLYIKTRNDVTFWFSAKPNSKDSEICRPFPFGSYANCQALQLPFELFFTF